MLNGPVSNAAKISAEQNTLSGTGAPNQKNMIPNSLIKTERDLTNSGNHVPKKDLSPEKSKTQDDFEIAMKNKLHALTNSIKSKKAEGIIQAPNGILTEKPRTHVNGYALDANKKLDFLSTDDSTIGYENGMSVSHQISMEPTEPEVDCSKDITANGIKQKNDIIRPNGFTPGHAMLTLTSLLTGNTLLAGNGVTPVNNLFAASEVKSEFRQKVDNAAQSEQSFSSAHPVVAPWDSLRERSRKYKLARKIKKSEEPIDLGDNIRIEGVGEEQVHVCAKCDRKFKKRNHVKQHLIQHHKLHLGDKNVSEGFIL